MTRFELTPVLRAPEAAAGDPGQAASQAELDAREILAIERAAFERWARGDVHGFLEASDPEVNYFDPFAASRLDGLAALRALYEPLQETFELERWEMIDPQATVADDMGVLTFNFEASSRGRTSRWNTTEVYRRTAGEWKIVHTHWALNRPELAKSPA